MENKVLRVGGVSLGVVQKGPEVHLTVAKAVFVFTEVATPEEVAAVADELQRVAMRAFAARASGEVAP